MAAAPVNATQIRERRPGLNATWGNTNGASGAGVVTALPQSAYLGDAWPIPSWLAADIQWRAPAREITQTASSFVGRHRPPGVIPAGRVAGTRGASFGF